MKVLVGCEYSGRVRQAFRALGHEAWSCDVLPSEDNSPHHHQCDVRELLGDNWDMAIFHPPCTHLAVSGARWFKDKLPEQAEALEFVRLLLNAPIPRIALENPVSILKPDTQAGSGDSTLAVRSWGDENYLPLAERITQANSDEHRCWPGSESAPDASWPEQVERPEPHIPRRRRSNGGPMGTNP
jgi:hypothetical protein